MNITLTTSTRFPFMKTGATLEESKLKHNNFDLEGLKLML